jgi:DHA3 family macrolide efflux protein-like MFS transporter
MFSILGSSVVLFSTTWYYTIETRSASFLSFALFLAMLPQIVTTLFAGVIVDRANRKVLIFIADAAQALLTIILILWFIYGNPGVWEVVIIMIFRGLCQAFHQPAVNSIIPLMVPKKHLTRMNGVQFISRSALQVIGPALAAILLTQWTFQQILWLDVITFIIAAIPLISAKIPSQHKDIPIEQLKKSPFKDELRDGFHTLISIKGMIPLFAIAMVLNATTNPYFTLQTYFIVEYHGGNAIDLALIMSSLQFAIFLGAIMTILKKKWSHQADWIMASVWIVIFGYFIMVIAPVKQFTTIMIGAFLFGLGIPIFNNLYLTIIQSTIPPQKLGRVNSIDAFLSMAIAPIMMISAGPLAELIGIKQLFFIMIGLSALSTILISIFSDYRNLNENFKFENVTDIYRS